MVLSINEQVLPTLNSMGLQHSGYIHESYSIVDTYTRVALSDEG